MRLCLDVCCLNRPFDDQSQDRIRAESEAVQLIFDLCVIGRFRWVSSDVVEAEVARNPDNGRRNALLGLLKAADERLVYGPQVEPLARVYVAQGLKAFDAAHLALAATFGCDILLTTDDAFLRCAERLQPPSNVKVENPARWLTQVLGL
jgi:predicted nucleic acid-binding protein